jgi:predicted RNA-binding protein YlxR (DUF448 family)
MNLIRHVPIRMCIGCGSRRTKGELIRFGREDSRSVSLDARRHTGRGFYLCPDLACLNTARRKMRRSGFLEGVDFEVLKARMGREKEKREEVE